MKTEASNTPPFKHGDRVQVNNTFSTLNGKHGVVSHCTKPDALWVVWFKIDGDNDGFLFPHFMQPSCLVLL
jgi:hypothetical protein